MSPKKIIISILLIFLIIGTVNPNTGGSWICLIPPYLNFAYVKSGQMPPYQRIRINNAGGGALIWTAQTHPSWVSATPGSGTGSGELTVIVDPTGLDPGTYTGNILVTAPGAGNSPRSAAVTLTVFEGGTSPPVGAFETPVCGSHVSGSIPVTGTALDDVGVESVKIYRQDVMGNVLIGDASSIEDPTSSIPISYPGYPNNFQANWGYMLLTNFLPDGGNGTFVITAIATDVEGQQTVLGNKTIICDNAHAVKPFGAIDTPTQGGTASGSKFVNWGWALTPQPNIISTIDVYVDGESVGPLIHGVYRQDIADLFPGYNNSNGAAGYFYLDTTPYANGVHTIGWSVSDDAGNSDGFGPRLFTIQNNDGPTVGVDKEELNVGYKQSGPMPPYQTFRVYNTGPGTLPWTVLADRNWLIVDPPSGTNSGQVTVGFNTSGLPTGRHHGKIIVSSQGAYRDPQTVTVNLNVFDDSQNTPPFGSFDTPVDGSAVRSSIPVTGWALDDSGVDVVKIYWQAAGSTGMHYIGDADLVEGARPDVEQAYPNYPMNNQAGWGYMMLTNFLPNGGNGTYTIQAVATDNTGKSTTLGTKTIVCDNANAVKPFGAIDTPWWAGTAWGTNSLIGGWILTPNPNKISEDGSTINVWVDGVNLGHPTYNIYRPDIAAMFPGYANANGAGIAFGLNTTEYADGVHTIYLSVTDDAGNTDGIGSRYFKIQNNPEPSQPAISTNKKQLNFASAYGGDPPKTQTILISNSGGGTLNWEAIDDAEWIFSSPPSGTNAGVTTVYVDVAGLDIGTYDGTITVSDPNVGISQTVDVRLDVKDPDDTSSPFGDVSTPSDGATVSGSISVTGWVLDDVGVDRVGIYVDHPMGPVHIGDATLVEGARPDIATSYPDYPNNHSAGWDFTLITNALPGGGNGTYGIIAEATDVEGNQATLGTRVIYCNNANAVKPFGAIDTPAQGGTASGTSYRNQGWALTPMPNKILKDGSTIDVYIDGQKVGNATYDIYRQDIFDLFPGYANSQGAHAYFDFDTTPYENGVHTIYWTATDGAGNTDCIGRRAFVIQNTEGASLSLNKEKLKFGANLDGKKTPSQMFQVNNTGGGVLHWTATPDESWLSCNPTSGTDAGAVVVSVDPSGLGEGSYNGIVTISSSGANYSPQTVHVELNVNTSSYGPIGELNNPVSGSMISGSTPVTGWVLDYIGVGSVKIYHTGSEIYLGDAALVEGARPDIAQAYPDYPRSDIAGWSYSLLTNLLPDGGNGDFEIFAKAIDLEGNEVTLGTTTITADNLSAVNPFGDIDTPEPGSHASGTEYTNQGWVLTPPPNTIPVDGSTIEVYIDGVQVGTAEYNGYSEDIATQFPGYNNSEGAVATYTFDTTPYENGVHTISWTVTDDAENTTEGIGNRQFTIQNPPIVTAVDEEGDTFIPTEMCLYPCYPNPFNPETRIQYDLSESTRVDMVIYDILGRRVRHLINNVYTPAGRYKLTWRAKDDNGLQMSTGVYLLIMKTSTFIKTQKLILLR